jgi:hypothetical protein
VESRSALLYGAGRVDCLHCGGGYILSDWAPFSGNAPTDKSCVTCGCAVSYLGPEVLLEGELHVRLHSEYRGDGCFSSSLCSSDDYEGLRVPHDSADQWWSAKGYGEGTGQ